MTRSTGEFAAELANGIATDGPGGPPCAFCVRIARSEFTHAWSDAVTFPPRHPVVENDGHLLVVPRLHVQDATTDPVLTGKVMRRAAELAAIWPAANIITSIGSDATQTVFHLHVHVVRRSAGDGLTLPWTGQHRSPAALTAADPAPELVGAR